jgi:hypothetical protein
MYHDYVQAAGKVVQDLGVDLANTVNLLNNMKPHNMEVIQEVVAERARQDSKHGSQYDLSDQDCYIFTMEEVGEVSHVMGELLIARLSGNKGILTGNQHALLGELRKEIIETAACCVKWVQIMDRRKNAPEIETVDEMDELQEDAWNLTHEDFLDKHGREKTPEDYGDRVEFTQEELDDYADYARTHILPKPEGSDDSTDGGQAVPNSGVVGETS